MATDPSLLDSAEEQVRTHGAHHGRDILNELRLSDVRGGVATYLATKMAFKMTPLMEASLRNYGDNNGYQIAKELAVPDEEYIPRPFPVEFPKFTEKVKFGAEMREKHFYLEKGWAYLNHGAYGAAVKEALEAEMTWLMFCERQPVMFFSEHFFPHLVHAIRRMAKFIDADRNDVVFVPNATVGNNTVIRSVVKTLKPGDSIMALNLNYGTVTKLLKEVERESEIRVDHVNIRFPIDSSDSIVQLIEEAIKPDTKFAVLDHVTSVHALVLPIKEMIAVCHKRGVQVLVDAAHCLGSLPISMKDIGADYYVANGHKWLLSPKGCAVLYVAKERQDIVRPLVVSWGHELGFGPEFGWIGTSDCTPYLCTHTVIDFWEFYGPDTIREYLYETTKKAGELLVKEWDTELLADPSFFRTMVTVRLPDGLIPADGPQPNIVDGKPEYDFSHGGYIGGILRREYKIEATLKAIQGRLYVRLSIHVYTELSECQRLADAINDIRKKNL